MNPAIFRKYDIRGNAENDLTTDVVTNIGKAIGTTFQREFDTQHIIVGRDNRTSGNRLRDALLTGITSTGANVTDIGIVSTPTLYWYAVQEQTGGIMITGSHLNAPFNGFKMCYGNIALYGEQVLNLQTMIQENDFATGTGTITVLTDNVRPYIQDVASKVSPKPHKVVVDCGNGTSGVFADALMSIWNQDATILYPELDGTFPNHPPDPSKAKNLAQLIERVKAEDADLGLAFDGDADRVVAVAENGDIVAPDRFVALLAQDVLTRFPGATIIGDVTSSQALFDTIAEAGGDPIMWMTGHSLIKEKMRETNAILAGEISGHIFFSENYYGFDDAYLAAGKLLHLLGNQDKTLSELNAALPTYYSTKVFRPECPPDKVQDILAALKTDLATHATEIILLDGIRAQFPAGWAIIRPSNTEPVLSIRIEGKTCADAIQYRDWVVATLQKFAGVELEDITGKI